MLWGISLGFDGMARFASQPLLGVVAVAPLGAGVAVGAFAASGELSGLLRMQRGDRAQRAAFWILIAEVTALGLCCASLWFRTQGDDAGLAGELTMIAFVLAMLAGFARDLLGLQWDRPARRVGVGLQRRVRVR
jgi:uncharacterized membrane protein